MCNYLVGCCPISDLFGEGELILGSLITLTEKTRNRATKLADIKVLSHGRGSVKQWSSTTLNASVMGKSNQFREKQVSTNCPLI